MRFAGVVGQEVPVGVVALKALPVGEQAAPLAHDHWERQAHDEAFGRRRLNVRGGVPRPSTARSGTPLVARSEPSRRDDG
jgi:hypothetical protein